MPIAIACPHCDWKGKVADTLAGQKGKCPTCGELVPIPKRSAPPPVRGGKKAVDDEPDVVDDADIVDDAEEDRPSKSRGAVARRRPDDDDDRPSRSRRRVDDDDDERPSRSRRRPADDEDEDERPARARRRPTDDDDEDERPSRSRRRVDDDEEEDRPRKKRGGPKKRRRAAKKSGMSGKRIGAIVGGVFALLVGGAWLAWYLLGDNGRFRIYPIFLLVGGLIGLFQGVTGAGLGEDDDE